MNKVDNFFNQTNMQARARAAAPGAVLSVGAAVSALLLAAAQARADDPLPCDPTYATSCIVHSYGTTPTNPGAPGGPANPISGTLTGPSTLQEVNDPSTGTYFSPLDVRTGGGQGAAGEDGKATDEGGDGGTGGLAGNITVTLAVGTPSSPANIQALVADADTTNNIVPLTISSQGGAGGNAGAQPSNGIGGTGGSGGNSGSITASLDGYWLSYQTTRSAVVSSQGGQGGVGAAGDQGEDGGIGGNAGDLNITLSNALNQQNPAPGQWTGVSHQFDASGGILIQSVGGQGGAGGAANGLEGSSGGNGGTGGTAGNVTVTVNSNVNSAALADDDSALWVKSQGGTGGDGGSHGGSGGTGGAGNNAGNVSLIFNGGTFQTQGSNDAAVLAQSFGGVGGNGGAPYSRVIGPNGGSGEDGGNAGTVTLSTGTGASAVNVTTVSTTPSRDVYSPGVLAQSIGGGGGNGADAHGVFAIGGNAANGVAGNTVSVDLKSIVSTNSFHSEGIVAQSIGGGGGQGGDASGTSGVLQLVVGGAGGGGGNGGVALLTSEAGSQITTTGDHSPGLEVQSIGGGGGSGGAAYGSSISTVFGATLAVGGSGENGGNGSTVNVDGAGNNHNANAGVVWTTGSDSYGILAQSIGGGGGAGGASTAKAHSYGGSDYPNISLAVAVGGTAGAGGYGNTVFLGNTGLVVTQGAGADGMLSQSIGGGGGTGGNASSASSATGGAYNVSASLSFGGTGGQGGAGGVDSVASSGLIFTTGESAYGMLAQSIGGGGGAGGTGDAKANASSDDGKNLAATLALGGKGSSGGDANSVSATNVGGAIITLGDGAVGMAAQAIGGGGGRAGGAAGSTSSGDYTATVNVGGNGGAGGSAFAHSTTVSANNLAGSSIVTFGADATGILAQSIGGGGGVGGKTATSLATSKSDGAGGNSSSSTLSTIEQAYSAFKSDSQNAINSYNNLTGAIGFVNDLLGNSSSGVRAGAVGDDSVDGELDDLAQSKGETEDDNESTSIGLTVALGGKGGTGGAAGQVTVTNDGEVATVGHHSDAILAQSIGGGGGKGGAASTATTVTTNDPNTGYSGSIDVGGSGGAGGNGGNVTVTNTGTLITEGALSNGIVAQSIAGGGGIGGASASSVTTTSKNDGDATADDGAFHSLSLSIGGNGNKDGISGEVSVTSSGAIQTKAHDAIGILAQSIAGGGGIIKTMATDLEGAGGSASGTESIYGLDLTFGGAGESVGESGSVNVTTQQGGTITTHGDDSYGILAQSISGGGGLVQGGSITKTTLGSIFGSGVMVGTVAPGSNPDGSTVLVTVGDNITTSGTGAFGVLAQSIGGGGGIAGFTGQTGTQLTGYKGGTHRGNGGYLHVDVQSGATVSTSGEYATAIYAQSLGGGGGRFTTQSVGAFTGTAGGSGQGGAIYIDVAGTVQASGGYANGIFAQSDGDTAQSSTLSVWVEHGGLVGSSAVDTGVPNLSAAVSFDRGGQTAGSGTQNEINVDGTIIGGNPDTQGMAIYTQRGYTLVTVSSTGVVTGTIDLVDKQGGGAGSGGKVDNNGTINASSIVASGGILNKGVIDIRNPGESQLTANPARSEIKAASAAGTPGQQAQFVGDYVGMAGSKLVLGADFSGGKSDQLTIDGSATIAGQIDVRPTSLRKSTLTVISSTGPLTVDPALRGPEGTHLFDYQVAQSGNTLQVTPQAHFTDQAASLGHTEQGVAGSLQNVFDSGAALDAGFAALAQVKDDVGYAANLRSIAGQGLGAFGAFRINSSRTFSQKLYTGCRELTADTQTTDSCAWSRVSGGSADQDAGRDTAGYHADAVTLDVGGQVSLGEKLALVGSIGAEKSQFHGDGLSTQIEGNAAVGGVGLNFAQGAWELSGAIDGAYGWYRSTRSVTVGDETGSAIARPRQWQVGAHLRAGYSIPFSSILYTKPFVEAHAIHVDNGSFAEEGTSPFRLAVDGRSDTTVLGAVGMEFGAHIPVSAGADFHPYVSAAAEFDQDTLWTTTARFADQPTLQSFDVRTAGPGTLGRFSIGADLINSKNLSFSLSYDPEIGRGYTAQAGTARVSYRF